MLIPTELHPASCIDYFPAHSQPRRFRATISSESSQATICRVIHLLLWRLFLRSASGQAKDRVGRHGHSESRHRDQSETTTTK